MLYILNSLLVILLLIISITFYRLLERKILGYIQIRKGPNKVRLIGIPQPLADAIKLFTKELNMPFKSNYFFFILIPIIRLFLALILWNVYPRSINYTYINYGILFFFCVSRINVYITLGSGWFSNSKYSLLGSLRRVAQTISYEIRIILIIISSLCIFKTFNIINIVSIYTIFFFFGINLFFCWFISILAETNRAPFDFVEGESELVSGFNVEYRGGLFAFIFIAEYLNIIFIRIISYVLYISFNFIYFNFFFIILFVLFFRYCFLWVRGSYPRMRFDILIILTWKSFIFMRIRLLILYINIL